MKNKIVHLALSFVLAVGLLQAQGKRGKHAMDNLGLNEEQKPQVQAILKESREAAMKARETKDRAALRQIQKDTQDKLSKVLTEEQMQKWQAAAKERRGRKKA